MLDAITFSMVIARDTAKHTGQSEHMNAKLSHVMKPHSQRNYAQTKLAVKL